MKNSMTICRCGLVHPADAVVALDRFQGTSGYRAQVDGAPTRATRAEAMKDVCPYWVASWRQALTAYDAGIAEDGRIVRHGKTLGVRIHEHKQRLRIESVAGTLLASGPIAPATVERFVERFWFWEKTR
jgi:hypothetical protein